MSSAPRSATPAKQASVTTGSRHAPGSVVVGLGTSNSTLRSESSICSSFLYWRSPASPAASAPDADLLQQVRVAEREAERYDQRHRPRVVLHHDPARRERRQLRVAPRALGALGSISPWTIACARKPTVANSLASVASTLGL